MLAAPNGKLSVIRLYATTSLPKAGGQYVQEERTARPAVKETFELFKNHDATNRSAPWNDTLLANSIISFVTAKPPNEAGRSMKIASVLKSVLIPDESLCKFSETELRPAIWASKPKRAILAVADHRRSSSIPRCKPCSALLFRNLDSRRMTDTRRPA